MKKKCLQTRKISIQKADLTKNALEIPIRKRKRSLLVLSVKSSEHIAPRSARLTGIKKLLRERVWFY